MLISAVGITFIIIGGVLLLFFLFGILPMFIISNKVFNMQLVRNKKDKWLRECSAPDNKEQVAMYDAGLEWAKGFEDKKVEVEIENDGLHLVGEFFNFNSDKCVIILQGRTESLWYSYYYAKPYSDMGYSILVVDSRAHGLSDGKYNTVGLKEYKDIIKWGKLVHDKFGIKHVIFHGVCIGSATALYALTSPDTPDYFDGIIADGMYTTFYETFKTHMIYEKRPVHPVIDFIRLIMKIKTGVDMKKYGPEKALLKLKKPILFLYSKEDKFSLPVKSEYLYSITPNDKQIVWFDHGAHSHIRINNLEKYDNAVKDFCNEKFN